MNKTKLICLSLLMCEAAAFASFSLPQTAYATELAEEEFFISEGSTNLGGSADLEQIGNSSLPGGSADLEQIENSSLLGSSADLEQIENSSLPGGSADLDSVEASNESEPRELSVTVKTSYNDIIVSEDGSSSLACVVNEYNTQTINAEPDFLELYMAECELENGSSLDELIEIPDFDNDGSHSIIIEIDPSGIISAEIDIDTNRRISAETDIDTNRTISAEMEE